MAASNKLLITESKQWVVTVQKVRVEDYFDPVIRIIEQVASLQGQEHWILFIFTDIVGCDGWPEG